MQRESRVSEPAANVMFRRSRADDLGQAFVWLHPQTRSAWMHELDLRPWQERF
jgi:hypothetical protein